MSDSKRSEKPLSTGIYALPDEFKPVGCGDGDLPLIIDALGALKIDAVVKKPTKKNRKSKKPIKDEEADNTIIKDTDRKILSIRADPKTSYIIAERLCIGRFYVATMINDVNRHIEEIKQEQNRLKIELQNMLVDLGYFELVRRIDDEEDKESSLNDIDLSVLLGLLPSHLDLKHRLMICEDTYSDDLLVLETLSHLFAELSDAVRLWESLKKDIKPKTKQIFVLTKPANMFLKWVFDEDCRKYSLYHVERWTPFEKQLVERFGTDIADLLTPIPRFGEYAAPGEDREILSYANTSDYDLLSTLFDFLKRDESYLPGNTPIKTPLIIRYYDREEYIRFVNCFASIVEAFDLDAPKSSYELLDDAAPLKSKFNTYSDQYHTSKSHEIDARNKYKTTHHSSNDFRKYIDTNDTPVSFYKKETSSDQDLSEESSSEDDEDDEDDTNEQESDETSDSDKLDSRMDNIAKCVEAMRISVGYNTFTKLQNPRWVSYPPTNRQGGIYPDVFDIWNSESDIYNQEKLMKTDDEKRKLIKTKALKFVKSPTEDATRIVEWTSHRWFGAVDVIDKDYIYDDDLDKVVLSPPIQSKCVPKLISLDVSMRVSPSILFSQNAYLNDPLFKTPSVFRLIRYQDLETILEMHHLYALMRYYSDEYKLDVCRWVRLQRQITTDGLVELSDMEGNILYDIPMNALFLFTINKEAIRAQPKIHSQGPKSAPRQFLDDMVVDGAIIDCTKVIDDDARKYLDSITNDISYSVKQSNMDSFFDLSTYDRYRRHYASVGFYRTMWNHTYGRGMTLSLKFGSLKLDKTACDNLWMSFRNASHFTEFVKMIDDNAFLDKLFEDEVERDVDSNGYLCYFEDDLYLPVCYEYRKGVRALPYTNNRDILRKYLSHTAPTGKYEEPIDVLVHAGIVATSCDRHIDTLRNFSKRRMDQSHIVKKHVKDIVFNGIFPINTQPQQETYKTLLQKAYRRSDMELDYCGLDEVCSARIIGEERPLDCNVDNINRLYSSWDEFDSKMLERFECNTAAVILQDKNTNGRAAHFLDGTEDPDYFKKPHLELQTLISQEKLNVLNFRLYCSKKRAKQINPIYSWCNNLQYEYRSKQSKLQWKTLVKPKSLTIKDPNPNTSEKEWGQTMFNCLRRGAINDMSQITMDIDYEAELLPAAYLVRDRRQKTGEAQRCHPGSTCATVINVDDVLHTYSSFGPAFIRLKYRESEHKLRCKNFQRMVLSLKNNAIEILHPKGDTTMNATIVLEKSSLNNLNVHNPNRIEDSQFTPEYEYVKYANKQHRSILVEATAPWAFEEGIVINRRMKQVSDFTEEEKITYDKHKKYMGSVELGTKLWPKYNIHTQKIHGNIGNCFYVDRQPYFNIHACYISSLNLKYLQKYKSACKTILHQRFGNDATLFFTALLRYLSKAPENIHSKIVKYLDKYVLLSIFNTCLDIEKWDGIHVEYDDHSKCEILKKEFYDDYKYTYKATVNVCKRVATAMGLFKMEMRPVCDNDVSKHILSVMLDTVDHVDQDEYIQQEGHLSPQTIYRNSDKLKESNNETEYKVVPDKSSCDKKYCMPCAMERRAARCLFKSHLEKNKDCNKKERKKRKTFNANAQKHGISCVQYHVGCVEHISDIDCTEIPQICKFDAKHIASEIALHDLTLKWLLKLSALDVLTTFPKLDPNSIKPWLDIHKILGPKKPIA